MACEESLALLFMVPLLLDLVLMLLVHFDVVVVGAGVVLVTRGAGGCSLNVGTFVSRAHRRALRQNSSRLAWTVAVAGTNGGLTAGIVVAVGHAGGDKMVWLHSWTTPTTTTVDLVSSCSRRLWRVGS